MGSLESGQTSKRDHHILRSSSRNSNSIIRCICGCLGQRNRSRFARLVFFRRIDYLHLICFTAGFLVFIFLFQLLFLPGSSTENEKKFDKPQDLLGETSEVSSWDMSFLKDLDFGEGIKFEPLKIENKFQKDVREVNASLGSRKVTRFGHRKPKLALVFADLLVDPHQILMVTVATALRETGYEIEVLSLEDGPVRATWREVGFPLSIIAADENMKLSVDWLNYEGILISSLKAVEVLSCLMQEPFKNVPLVWTIHEETLAARLQQYVSSGQNDFLDSWRKVFSRPTVVVFPNYALPITYAVCDPGNYFVIPGSPEAAWEADKLITSRKDNMHLKIEKESDDFVIAVVGSRILYRGLWLEHALILQALHPHLADFVSSNSHLKIIVLAGDSAGNYSSVVETIAVNLKYPNEMVKHVAVDGDIDHVLRNSSLVIYGSFLEERSFPDILLKAMCLEKPIVAPDLPMIRKYVSNRVNGFLFPKDDHRVLTQIMSQLVSNGKLSLLAQDTASVAKRTAKNLMVTESVEGYASLLENILMLPSEVASTNSARDISTKFKDEWKWNYFEGIAVAHSLNGTRRNFLDKVEKQFNRSPKDNSIPSTLNDTFLYAIWEDQKETDMASIKKRREDEELKDRTDQPRGTWDEVYRNARRADRSLHERDEGELVRTGQPLCIYEPYVGEGTWPFLHNTSLYRGLGLSTKGRRPGGDDVDLPSRLPLLSSSYYRDILGEYGAFFAIANRIDRIHRNAWIGFQSWRATARKISLSKTAERSLLDAIEARKHGDTLYFWAFSEMDPRNPLKQDFWSFCDSINAGNCRFVFSAAMEKMYGIKHNVSSLPPMPMDEGTWSVMHCWALPTKSFMEFVMFSRMFVDALDAQSYDDHTKTGRCYLSLSKDKHCYSRLLELLVNVWAYHSARRMVYVNPQTGVMQEQHGLKSRRGRMWIKWFQYSTLKSMDEDLAEEFDTDHPKRHWLWPSTGEIFWQGIYEKDKNQRIKDKERKKQQSKEKIERIKKRTRQKALGTYVKPQDKDSNSTVLAH